MARIVSTKDSTRKKEARSTIIKNSVQTKLNIIFVLTLINSFLLGLLVVSKFNLVLPVIHWFEAIGVNLKWLLKIL